MADVLAMLKVSRPTLWEWRRKGLFPQAIRLGPNTIVWRASDIEKWERSRPRA